MERENPVIERYAYCLCLHVRPGTIFIGVVNLAESLLIGIIFLVALVYHQTANDEVANELGISSQGMMMASSMAVVIYMIYASMAAMLLFGVVKGRPSYLMPFFWIRLCEFFFYLPTYLSSLYANPAYNSHQWDSSLNHQNYEQGMHYMKKILPHSGSAHHPNQSLFSATISILFRGYFLCVVWKCYRYLKMRELLMMAPMTYGGNGVGAQHHGTQGTEIVLPPGFIPPQVSITNNFPMSPPDYETATKEVTSPPDYETAMQHTKPESESTELDMTTIQEEDETISSSSMGEQTVPHIPSGEGVSHENQVTINCEGVNPSLAAPHGATPPQPTSSTGQV